MFDIGFWEISLIGIVALVVVGPEKLPGMVKTAGRLIGRGQAIIRDLRYELEREADMQELRETREMLSVNDAINAGEMNRFKRELEEAVENPLKSDDKSDESSSGD